MVSFELHNKKRARCQEDSFLQQRPTQRSALPLRRVKTCAIPLRVSAPPREINPRPRTSHRPPYGYILFSERYFAVIIRTTIDIIPKM